MRTCDDGYPSCRQAESGGVWCQGPCMALADQPHCRRCGALLQPGIALAQTGDGAPDFPGGAVVTLSPSGPGQVIDCLKCPACGHSLTTG